VAALGVRIALDDFGTGFWSLSYLRELPIHELKIDRSFVHPIATDERSAALLGAIAGLARVLHLGVTVEGVETEAQMEIVRELGCDDIQGYVLSPAVDPADLPRVVAEIERGERKKSP
jgi:EAL domain-containing protein (putative c-di-GMP-specific phosphodiesterase class I)